jgi:hypothetical protein
MAEPLDDAELSYRQYRTAPDKDYPYAFWQKGQLTDKDFPDHG